MYEERIQEFEYETFSFFMYRMNRSAIGQSIRMVLTLLAEVQVYFLSVLTPLHEVIVQSFSFF